MNRVNREYLVKIAPRTIILTLVLVAFFNFFGPISGILIDLWVAMIIAAGMHPGIRFFRERLHLGRIPATMLMFLLMLAAVLAVLGFAVPMLASQVEALVQHLPTYLANLKSSYSWFQAYYDRYTFLPDLDQVISQAARTVAASLSSTLSWAGKLVSMLVTLFIVALATFFLLVDGPNLKRIVLTFFPPERRPMAALQMEAIVTKLGQYVQGMIIAIGFLVIYLSITLSIAKVPGALLLAVIAGFMELIPNVGSLLGAIPAIIVAATIDWKLALIVAGIYLAGNAIQGNVVYPLVYAKSIEIPPLITTFSLLIFSTLLGIGGALIAVPTVAAIQVLLQNLYVEPMERRQADEATLGLIPPPMPSSPPKAPPTL